MSMISCVYVCILVNLSVVCVCLCLCRGMFPAKGWLGVYWILVSGDLCL